MAPLPAENIFTIIFLPLIFSVSKARLHAHYYDQTCPQLEKIISETVLKASKHDPKVPARIWRMFFHDKLRKMALLISQFDGSNFYVIDEAKAKLELAGPRTVFCADIIAISARDV